MTAASRTRCHSPPESWLAKPVANRSCFEPQASNALGREVVATVKAWKPSDQVKTFSLAATSVDQSAPLHVNDDGIGERSDDLHVKGVLRFRLIGK